MKKINVILIIFAILATLSCTKLDQSLRGETTQDDPNITAGGLLSSAYETLNSPYQAQDRLWCLTEHTTDEVVGPTRGGDWDDNGVWRVLHAHTWDADHSYAAATFKELLQTQFAASLVLSKTTTPQQNAEARFIRALSMFSVLDNWDQVPFRSDLVDLTKLPETKKGADCANFIISELEAIVGNLPATGPAYKANRSAANTLLMKLYLNKGVYGNRAAPTFAAADMSKVAALADQITGYSLTPSYFQNFAPTNDALSSENIYTLENAPGVKGGNIRSR